MGLTKQEVKAFVVLSSVVFFSLVPFLTEIIEKEEYRQLVFGRNLATDILKSHLQLYVVPPDVSRYSKWWIVAVQGNFGAAVPGVGVEVYEHDGPARPLFPLQNSGTNVTASSVTVSGMHLGPLARLT